jgi:hypothetical protein
MYNFDNQGGDINGDLETYYIFFAEVCDVVFKFKKKVLTT